jgi:hypothetical protein
MHDAGHINEIATILPAGRFNSYNDFNKIRVRSFVLIGAPYFLPSK